MATSGQINTNTTYDSYFWVKWEQLGDQDVANNRTLIGWTCGLYTTHKFYSNAIKMSAFSINGTQVYSGGTYSNFTAEGNQTIASGTLWINHNEDGTKTFTISSFTGWLYSNHNYSSNGGNYTLTTISRYAKITSFSVSKRDETSVSFNYTVDATCDMVWYSINNGVTWSLLPQNKIVNGLTPNTTYKFQLCVRRKDSKLDSYSGLYEQSTYDYPKPTAMNSFLIGNGARITVDNPLGRSYKLELISKESNTEIGSYIGTINGDVYDFKTLEAVDKQYASIPNKKVGGYYAKVSTLGGEDRTLDVSATYSIQGYETPAINEITYADTSAVVEITENDQYIVQNQSNLKVFFEEATPRYEAGGIAKYTFELNGVIRESTSAGGTIDFGKVNIASDTKMNITVTDSRGMSAYTELDIKILEHKEPTATVTLNRVNNYEDKTYLTVDASISSVDNKNTMTIEYRYKLSTDEYSPFVEINNGETQTLLLEKSHTFIFNVVVTDIFGWRFDKEYILYKGVFPLFIDTEKNAVGINDFPSENEALRVSGGVSHFKDGVKIADNELADYIVERGTEDGWTYKKMASGDAECWGYLEWSGSVNTATGSGRYIGSNFNITFPENLFVAVPYVFVAEQFGAYSFEVIRNQWSYATAEKSGDYNICTETSIATPPENPFRIVFNAKGRWK